MFVMKITQQTKDQYGNTYALYTILKRSVILMIEDQLQSNANADKNIEQEGDNLFTRCIILKMPVNI